jgi:hypothetical protein
MTAHALKSPSKAPRWRKCAASVREEMKYPEEKSGPAAIDGTHTHTLLETCIASPIFRPADFIGQELTDHEGAFTVDAARAERVAFALDVIRQNTTPSAKVFSERKVDPVTLLGVPGLGGTVDITILGDDMIGIFDYKDGMGVIEADSEQPEQYGFGVIAELPTSEREKYKTVRLGIIQPKLREKGMRGFAYVDIPMDEFMARAPKLIEDAKAADAPDAPYNPGESQCKYCRARGSCSALAQSAMQSMGVAFQALDVAQQAADKDPATMTDEQIRELIEAKPLILTLIENVEKEAMRRFEQGHGIAGLKVVRGRGTRAWAEDAEKTAAALKRMGLPKDVIWKTELISPAQAEKVVWKNRAGVEKTLSDKQVKVLQSEYIKKSDGKLTIAGEADDRPAVTMENAASMFGPVTLPDFLQP